MTIPEYSKMLSVECLEDPTVTVTPVPSDAPATFYAIVVVFPLSLVSRFCSASVHPEGSVTVEALE